MIKKIAHITDLHLDEKFPFGNKIEARRRFDSIIDDIENENINRVVCTGDIGEGEGLQYFFEKLNGKQLSITLGNHDSLKKIAEHYDFGFNHCVQIGYTSSIGDHYKLIYLDSSEGIIDADQLVWLELEINTSWPIIIFIHHPIIGVNLKVDKIGKLRNREEVLDVLMKVTKEIVIFCGHYHMASTLTFKNITQNITPAVAFQIDKNLNSIDIDTSKSGYRIISMANNRHSSKVKYLANAD